MPLQLRILRQEYFQEYKTQLKVDVDAALASLKNTTQTVEDFNPDSYRDYLANSAVHSSNIEGNSVSFDT